MALTNLIPADNFVTVETKLDATIDAVNQFAGGTTGQMLIKTSNTDFDVEWANQPTVDISGKYDTSKILITYTSSVGPTTYMAETIMLTLTPSASKNCSNMKYTFMGYVNNGDVSTNGTVIRINKNGVEMRRTVCSPDSGSQQSFCLVWYDTYSANDVITATAQAGVNQNLNYYILTCESFDAI